MSNNLKIALDESQEIISDYIKEIKELKERIDKAIEYINKVWKKKSYYEDIENCLMFCDINEFEKEDLLNILQGSEDNE